MRHSIIFFALILSACAPSQSSIQTAIAQTQAAAATPTESVPGNCTHWSDITGLDLLKAGRMCIYGDLYEQQSVEDENGATFVLVRFSSDPQAIYVIQLFDVPVRRGDCITVVGEFQRDADNIPYMSVDSTVEPC